MNFNFKYITQIKTTDMKHLKSFESHGFGDTERFEEDDMIPHGRHEFGEEEEEMGQTPIRPFGGMSQGEDEFEDDDYGSDEDEFGKEDFEDEDDFGHDDDFGDEDEFDDFDEFEDEDEFGGESEGSGRMMGMKSEGTCPSCKSWMCNCGGGTYDSGISVGRIKSFEAITGNLSEKKAKPDFLDLDKDGDKKESMKKAAADKKKGSDKSSKGDKKEDKKEAPKKGGKLSKAQEKLPPALRKAIASGVRD
jgi:hypothetical protein